MSVFIIEFSMRILKCRVLRFGLDSYRQSRSFHCDVDHWSHSQLGTFKYDASLDRVSFNLHDFNMNFPLIFFHVHSHKLFLCRSSPFLCCAVHTREPAAIDKLRKVGKSSYILCTINLSRVERTMRFTLFRWIMYKFLIRLRIFLFFIIFYRTGESWLLHWKITAFQYVSQMQKPEILYATWISCVRGECKHFTIDGWLSHYI